MPNARGAALARGRFELIRNLGEGGNGAVCEAYDRELDMRVALKQLSRFTPDALVRFKREFRTMADFRHANIVRLYELFEQEGSWFFTMELVQGVDFVSHVRKPEDPRGFDEARLRDGLAALARGLSALHRAGFVHRDVKPDNIRVTAEGRVVLLDFGLVTMLERGAAATEGQIFGTVDYMAPEQAEPGPVGPAADWYSLGVVLYESLTGELPFFGSAFDVLLRKRTLEPKPPHECVAHVPEDLDYLCSRLLAIDPSARPDGAEILSSLRAVIESRPPPPMNPSSTQEGTIGRDAEVRALTEAFSSVLDGGACLAVIEGESGVGKTTLMQEVAARTRDAHPEAVVLSSVCHERESVPFKAFDGIVDALAYHLSGMPEERYRDALPAQPGLLLRAFPVLARVPLIARAEMRVPLDPTVLRRLVFEGVLVLLRGLSRVAPLILCIDDLQWADSDSLALLQAILSADKPPRALFLCTVRPLARNGARIEGPLAPLLGSSRARHLRLSVLPAEAARKLVLRVAGDRLSADQADALVRESHGHPMFLAELARFAVQSGKSGAASATLEEAILLRTRKLSLPSRTLLQAVAVAAAPTSKATLRAALSMSGEELIQSFAELSHSHLVRGVGSTDVECYHDRVREAVVQDLGPQGRAALHAALARAFEHHAPEASARIALHWLSAGESRRALPWLERAAGAAEENLAFERAAQLYAELLTLAPDMDRARVDGFRIARARALENAGRSAEAAQEYLAALDGVQAGEALVLRKKAAQSLLQAGKVEQGLEVMRTLFQSRRMPFAETSNAALLRLGWHRFVLGFRNFSSEPGDPHNVDPKARDDLEVLFDLAPALGWVDMLRGVELQSRHLRLALHVKDPRHLSLGLAYEAAFAEASARGRTSADTCLTRARHIADRLNDPFLRAVVEGNRGLVSFFRVELDKARAALFEAERLYREECVGASWPLGFVRTNLLTVIFLRGECGLHTTLAGEWLRDAQERGDQLAYTSLLVLGAGFHKILITTSNAEAEEAVDASMANWPVHPFCTQHLGHIIAKVNIMRMRRDLSARDYLEQRFPEVEKSLLARSHFTLASLLPIRAHCLLDVLVEQRGAVREHGLKEVDRIVKRVGRLSTPGTQQRAALLSAQTCLLRGDHDTANAMLEKALAVPEQNVLALEKHAAIFLLGALRGGDEGKDLRHQALLWAHDNGFPDPYMPLQMTAPAVRALEDG